jgi:hypothetical protein
VKIESPRCQPDRGAPASLASRPPSLSGRFAGIMALEVERPRARGTATTATASTLEKQGQSAGRRLILYGRPASRSLEFNQHTDEQAFFMAASLTDTFPTPWKITDTGSAYKITDARGRPIAWCYYRKESALRNDYPSQDEALGRVDKVPAPEAC